MKRPLPPDFEILAVAQPSSPEQLDLAIMSKLPLGETSDFAAHVKAMRKAFKLFADCIDNDSPDKEAREKIAEIAMEKLDGHANLVTKERKGGVLELGFEATDKIGLAWVGLLNAVVANEIWRTCPHCTVLFRATTKRQRFCCDSHRAASHVASQTDTFADALEKRGVDKGLIDSVLREMGKR